MSYPDTYHVYPRPGYHRLDRLMSQTLTPATSWTLPKSSST